MCLRPFSTLTPLQVSLMSTNHTEGGRFLYGQFCFCVASLSGRTALPQIVTALRTVLFISHPIGVINRESPNGDFYKLPRRGDTQTSWSCVQRDATYRTHYIILHQKQRDNSWRCVHCANTWFRLFLYKKSLYRITFVTLHFPHLWCGMIQHAIKQHDKIT